MSCLYSSIVCSAQSLILSTHALQNHTNSVLSYCGIVDTVFCYIYGYCGGVYTHCIISLGVLVNIYSSCSVSLRRK